MNRLRSIKTWSLGLLLVGLSASGTASDDQLVTNFQSDLSDVSAQVINRLSMTGGFETDEHIRIEIPARMLENRGQVDRQTQKELILDLEKRLNHVAELSASALNPSVKKLLNEMTHQDALYLLEGSGDATFDFFTNNIEKLKDDIRSTVVNANESTGAVQSFERYVDEVLINSDSKLAIQFIDKQVDICQQQMEASQVALDEFLSNTSDREIPAKGEERTFLEQTLATDKELCEDLRSRQANARESLSRYYSMYIDLNDYMVNKTLNGFFYYIYNGGQRL